LESGGLFGKLAAAASFHGERLLANRIGQFT
jgi:hypothetical protein